MPLLSPAFRRSHLLRQVPLRPTFQGRTLRWRETFRQISSRIRLPRNSNVNLLHAANLRHGTDGSASPPKEGVLRIFSPLKIRRLRSGLNPRTWVPKASTLPLSYKIKQKHTKHTTIYIWLYVLYVSV